MTRVALAFVLILLIVTPCVRAQTVPELAAGTITTLRGDLYRVQVGDRVTVFLATREGILVADPLDRVAGAWLKAQLADRFPGIPVKYVIHTTHAFDRAEGSSLFRDTAEVVAHETFERSTSDARRRLEPDVATLDRDRDGVLEAAELNTPAGAAILAHDRDKDGRVTASELYAFVVSPKHTYTDHETIRLGGRSVQLLYPGPAFGAASTAILFPEERVVFVNRQPDITGRLFAGVDNPRNVTRWARTMVSLDADLLVTGRGEVTQLRDIAPLVAYIDDLVRATVAASELGQSAEDIRMSPALDRHTGAPYDAQRASNLAALRRSVVVFRVGIHATGAMNATRLANDYCADPYSQCERPRVAVGMIAGVTASRGRIGVSAEMMVAPQLIQWRTSNIYDEAVAHRETTALVLAGYTSPPGRRLSFSASGGLSYVVTDFVFLTRRRFTLVSSGLSGGRFADRQSAIGVAGGAEVALKLADRLAVVAPVRITRTRGNSMADWRGSVFVQAGVGLRYRLYRSRP